MVWCNNYWCSYCAKFIQPNYYGDKILCGKVLDEVLVAQQVISVNTKENGNVVNARGDILVQSMKADPETQAIYEVAVENTARMHISS
ncbi:hypothetical protein P3L10_015889 [Capsicum annuum]